MLLGFCRSRGGFSAALLLLSGSFGLAALVGLPLLFVAREQQLYGHGLPEGLSMTACRTGCGGVFTVQTVHDIIESGRGAVHALLGKREGADDALAPSEEGGGARNGDLTLTPSPSPSPPHPHPHPLTLHRSPLTAHHSPLTTHLSPFTLTLTRRASG